MECSTNHFGPIIFLGPLIDHPIVGTRGGGTIRGGQDWEFTVYHLRLQCNINSKHRKEFGQMFVINADKYSDKNLELMSFISCIPRQHSFFFDDGLWPNNALLSHVPRQMGLSSLLNFDRRLGKVLLHIQLGFKVAVDEFRCDNNWGWHLSWMTWMTLIPKLCIPSESLWINITALFFPFYMPSGRPWDPRCAGFVVSLPVVSDA